MDLNSLLIQNGFSQREAKIYLTCLEYKAVNVATIARVTNEKRSTIYSVIKELQKKGLINAIEKNKIAMYTAISPDHIANQLKNKYEQFKELLPAFSALTEKFGIAPKVEFYEWLDSIREIYDQILDSQVEIDAFLGTSQFPKTIQKYLAKTFFPRKIQKNIYTRTLLSDTPVNQKSLRNVAWDIYKREWKIVSWLTFLENIIINIYGPNRVMIAVFTEKEPFWLVISSYYLYEMLLSLFNFMRNLSNKTSKSRKQYKSDAEFIKTTVKKRWTREL